MPFPWERRFWFRGSTAENVFLDSFYLCAKFQSGHSQEAHNSAEIFYNAVS